MGSQRIYTLPVDQTGWAVNGRFDTVFNWEYDEMRGRLVTLYQKGKQKQWDSAVRIDWSHDVDPADQTAIPDEVVPIFGSDTWSRLSREQKDEVRHHYSAWVNSQFLHGEQGALVCTAKIVETVPDVDAKFYAATQVMDEARHVEAYARLLHEKFELAYPITPGLASLLENTLTDRRWDMTYLGMQILIEGLALAAFQRIRDSSKNRLAASVNAYVMQDESRHVAFGRLALRDYYPQLSDAERDEREEFVVDACYHMRDRFNQKELWQALDLPVEECLAAATQSEGMKHFRTRLFTRIVPTVKDIGLWGSKIRKAYEDMGVIQFQDMDPDSLSAQDEALARKLDTSHGLTPEQEASAKLAGVDPQRALEVQETIRLGAEE